MRNIFSRYWYTCRSLLLCTILDSVLLHSCKVSSSEYAEVLNRLHWDDAAGELGERGRIMLSVRTTPGTISINLTLEINRRESEYRYALQKVSYVIHVEKSLRSSKIQKTRCPKDARQKEKKSKSLSPPFVLLQYHS